MITIQCPACFHEMRVKDALLGKKIRCKECNEPVTVEVVEPPDDADSEPVFSQPAGSRPNRTKTRRRESPGQIALQFAIRYSGYILGAALLTAAFVAIFTSHQFAKAGIVLFGGGGLVICGAAYAWALTQAAGEEPLALLGFVLPRYGLRMILRHRERVQGPLPLFLAGVLAMGMGIIALRTTIPPPGGFPAKASPQPTAEGGQAGSAAAAAAAPRARKTMPQIGGPTPVPTEAIETLSVVKRGMRVWTFSGRWEQGTVVGRNTAGWLVVQTSDGFQVGMERSQPLHMVRIEASELKREDLAGVPAVTEESPVIPGQPRHLQEDFERARQKVQQTGES